MRHEGTTKRRTHEDKPNRSQTLFLRVFLRPFVPSWRIGLSIAISLLITALHCAADAQSAPSRPRPNFVFILVDDQRWDCLGCAGHPFLKTPNIDRIAREGAYFNNYFVTLPLCSPSRGSILTGQYAHKNGVIDNVNDHSALSHQLITFPRLLHDAGYTTAHIGKWHMG